MPDKTGLDHVGDGANRVFDRHRRIEPGRPVDIDVIDAEALEAVGEEVFYGGGAGIYTDP
jgi:hypothetical protein